jgi:8-oxo-dGTP pyrophosphatase MutT (NUDIX family)
MKSFKCQNSCCTYKVHFYNRNNNRFNVNNKKSGCFIYDPNNTKILLVQSRGQLWGCPKGTLQDNETTEQCAIREVKEETGLDIDEKQLLESENYVINSRVHYYFIEMKEMEVFIQNQDDNDANGIGWFNIQCLYNLVKNGVININHQCRTLVKNFFNVDIPYNKKI